MASLPLMSWRLTESTRPASTSGSILCGIFKFAFLRRFGARTTTMDCFGTDICAGGHNTANARCCPKMGAAFPAGPRRPLSQLRLHRQYHHRHPLHLKPLLDVEDDLIVQQVRDPCLVLEHELGGEEHDVRKFLTRLPAELDHLLHAVDAGRRARNFRTSCSSPPS